MNKKEAKNLCPDLKPQFNLGKSGITSTFIETVHNYLEAHEIIKIKALIASDKDSLSYYAEAVAQDTHSEILEKKGFTFVLFRQKDD